MKIFRNTCFTWWQVEMFEWAMLGCGLLVGAYFHEWVLTFVWPIAFITIVFCGYVTVIWWQQHKK